MEEDTVFYIMVLVFIPLCAFLFISQISQIRNNELEKNRKLFEYRFEKENKKDKKISHEKELKERHKAIVFNNFRVERFGHNMPLQQVNGIVNVKSMSEQNLIYQVDLGAQTCECLNFQKRKLLPKNHVARWCKHLLVELEKAGAFQRLTGILADVVKFQYTQCDKMYLLKHDELPEMIITISNESISRGWIDVYARKKRTRESIRQAGGEFERFGWNLHEKRWSYGNSPPGASLLRPFFQLAEPNDFDHLLSSLCAN